MKAWKKASKYERVVFVLELYYILSILLTAIFSLWTRNLIVVAIGLYCIGVGVGATVMYDWMLTQQIKKFDPDYGKHK
jgi:hypothetical protein